MTEEERASILEEQSPEEKAAIVAIDTGSENGPDDDEDEDDGAQFSRSTTIPLRRPSADTAVIVAAALSGLKSIYRPGCNLAKAGVMLMDLQPDTVQQGELDLQDDEMQDRGRLMSVLDELNGRYGRGTVLLASAGLAGERRAWSMKQERRTPGYTTRWADMPVARA